MKPLWIVEIIDVVRDGLLGFMAYSPCLPPQEFSFQGRKSSP